MRGPAAEIQLLNRLQRVIAGLPLRHRHPGIASALTLPIRVHHGELAGAVGDAVGVDDLPAQIETASVQDPLRNCIEINLGEILVRTDRGEVVVHDALHDHMIPVLKGIEVMEDKSIRGFQDAGLLAGETTRIPGDQPEATLAAGLGGQALSSSLLSCHIGNRVERDGVLQEHRPVGRDGEIVQKGKAGKAVGTVVKQLTGLRAFGGELHQPDGAARTGFDPEGDHAGATVMAGIKTRMGTEGFTFFEHTIQA